MPICPGYTTSLQNALATLASMVKLLEGDNMRQLRIEVYGIPAYCMNIEECMSVEVEANEKPWYHDIKACIKNSESPSSATKSEKKLSGACPANFS